MIVEKDITNQLIKAMNVIINLIKYTYSQLDAIKIWEISLLDWSIGILVLSIVIPIIFTLVKSGSNTTTKAIKERIKRND